MFRKRKDRGLTEKQVNITLRLRNGFKGYSNFEICMQQEVTKEEHWDLPSFPDLKITKSHLFSYSTKKIDSPRPHLAVGVYGQLCQRGIAKDLAWRTFLPLWLWTTFPRLFLLSDVVVQFSFLLLLFL